jgi:hypothetical protein
LNDLLPKVKVNVNNDKNSGLDYRVLSRIRILRHIPYGRTRNPMPEHTGITTAFVQ